MFDRSSQQETLPPPPLVGEIFMDADEAFEAYKADIVAGDWDGAPPWSILTRAEFLRDYWAEELRNLTDPTNKNPGL